MRRSWISPSSSSRRRRLRGGRAPEAVAPAGGDRPGDHPGRSEAPQRHLRRRLDARPPRRHGGQRARQRLYRGRARPARPQARRRHGGYLQRVPLTSYALDTARTALRAGRHAGRLLGLLPLPADVRGAGPADQRRPARLRGRAGGLGRVAHREALQGKLVVFRSAGDGPSIGAPNLGPQGPFGQVAGIAVTHIDPLHRPVRRLPPRAARRGQGRRPGAARRDPAPHAVRADDFGREAVRPAARRAQAGRGRPDGPGRRGLRGEGSPGHERRGVLEGSDPALRGQYVALGAHNDAIGIVAAGGPRQPPRLQHGHPSARRQRHAAEPPTADEAARIKGILDSLRRLRPARLDSIVNGADDDGSGSMGLLELAESLARRPGPSGR